MNTVKQFFNAASLRKLLVVFLAGVLVMMTTACGSATRANSPVDNTHYSNRADQGMYPHGDAQRDTRAADTKANELVRKAQQRHDLNNQRNAVDRVTPDKPLDRQAKDVGRSVKRAAQNAAESANEATQDVGGAAKRANQNMPYNS